MSQILQRFLSERIHCNAQCFLFFVFMLGFHRVCVGRMRGGGRKEKEASQSFCGFTHKRKQIPLFACCPPLSGIRASLLRKRKWVFPGPVSFPLKPVW